MPGILLIVLCCLGIMATAQTKLPIEQISKRQGLSQVFVPCILQDREGFLWAGTKNGLNRYDGRNFKVFKNDPDNPNSLSSSQIWALCEIGDFLLVGNGSGVLDFFNRKTQQVLHLPLESAGVGKAPYVQEIFLGPANKLFLLAGSDTHRRLYYATCSEHFWDHLPQQSEILKTLFFKEVHESYVFSVACTKDKKTLFMDAHDGFFSLDIQSGQKTPYPEADGYPHVPNRFRSNIRMDSQGGIWFIWGNTLQHFDGQRFAQYQMEFKVSAFWGITADRDLMFWYENQLLFVPIDAVQSNGRLSPHLIKNSLPIPARPIGQYYGASGIRWMGSDGLGIFKIGGTGIRRLQHLFAGTSVYGTIFSESDGSIAYLGPAGLRVFPENGQGPILSIARRPDANIPGLWRIANSPDGTRWLFASMKPSRPFLFKLNPDGRTTSYKIEAAEVGQKQGNIAFDPFQRVLWLAWSGILLRFDPAKESWQQFSFADVISFEAEVYVVQPMSDGRVWLGTSQGLFEAKTDGKGGIIFKKYQNEPGNPHSLRHNSVATLIPDPYDFNVLWIGTKGGGISRLDTRTGQFTHYQSRNGLPDDVIYGLLWSNGVSHSADTSKLCHLWASSNKGIIRFNPKTGEIRSFTEANGLQSDEFNTWAYAALPDGRLMFGGINGLNVFSPDDFSDNPNAPSVYITSLKVNNIEIKPADSTGILELAPEFTKRIKLQFDERNLTLEFAALEFSVPSKNRFRWILDGAENSWHPETEQNSATYLNLSPGRYYFKVMAANADGVWNPQPAVLEIVILPPWWRSWWAYLLYAIVLGFAARVLYQLQHKRRTEQAETRMLRELDGFKSRFFTNISHEFRTPLTVVLGTTSRLAEGIEAMSKSDLGKNLKLIHRNAENLLRLVNQILDLAKLESNSLKINYVNGDIAPYLHYLTESFQSLANVQNILLRSECHPSIMVMDYDPDRISQMVQNLLSNAIKFTPSGGRVSLRASIEQDALESGRHVLRIAVSDTGPGIREEEKPFLFDRFFQASNQAFAKYGGTGIGLSFTKELVKAMKGSIHVESEEGKGATFVVILPIHQHAAPAQGVLVLEKERKSLSFVEHASSPQPLESDPSLPSLLIIEDNPDVVEYLIMCLETDYRLEFAYNGQAGIDKAFDMIPDIIISDVMMPQKDGFEVCDCLKNDERTSHIPLVLLTAKATVEDRVAGLIRGADAYMAKPFNRNELMATLSSLIRMRQKLQLRYATAQAELPPTQDAGLQMEDAFLARIRAAVEEHLADSSFSGEALCRHLGMSYPVVYRKLSALTGRSLNVYIRLIRLQHAQQLLRSTTHSVSEIAYESGFNDPKFFSRVFAEEYGMTPSAFREKNI